MITDTDIKKMKKVFTTKDDLKSFITKDDSKFFATKDYVDKRFERLFKYLGHLFEPLDKLIKGFDELKDKISTNLDFLMGKYTKLDEEHTVLTEQNKRTNGKLANHEERISILEQRVVTP